MNTNMMTLVKKNRQELLKITSFVIFLHFLLMIWMTFSWKLTPLKNTQKKLVVNTVQLNPRPLSSVIEEKSLSKVESNNEEALKEVFDEPLVLNEAKNNFKNEFKQTSIEKKIDSSKPEEKAIAKEKVESNAKIEPKPAEKKTVSKPVEKVIKKVETKKTVASKKVESKKELLKTTKKENVTAKKVETKNTVKASPTQMSAAEVKAKKEADEKQQQLIASLKNSMAKLEKGHSNISAARSSLTKTTNVKAAISNLKIDSLSVSTDSPLSIGEKSYVDELINRLKLELKLPAHGEVELKLTLDRSGNVRTLKIISSQSAINTTHVEKNLKIMKFPAFGTHFKDSSQYTFTIKLSNLL